MLGNNEEAEKLTSLCEQVKNMIKENKYENCYKLIVEEMKSFPHAPQPHNLLGMLLERQGKHLLAMKHFRAAWALDPTYLPSRHNLEVYGTFFSKGTGAFDENDCPVLEEKNSYTIEYDRDNIGHIVRRDKNENQ